MSADTFETSCSYLYSKQPLHQVVNVFRSLPSSVFGGCRSIELLAKTVCQIGSLGVGGWIDYSLLIRYIVSINFH